VSTWASLLAVATAVTLPIPDRAQHEDAPPSGWCGETAIQEALLHHGAWVPQRAIHDAGKSKHPDLYSQDVPVALAGLGVEFDTHVPKKKGGFAGFLRDAIDAGDPVFAGVKILPTSHPEWGLDHFVLVVGHGPKGFLVNTTWSEQSWVTETTGKGITLAGGFYALRIRGVARPTGRTSARATVVTETTTTVRLRLACVGKETGTLERRDTPNGKVQGSWPLSKESPTMTVDVAASKAAWFYCG